MANRIQLRRDYGLNWTSADPVLDQGEPGVEVDTGRMKVGDGASTWSSLPYMSPGDQGPQGRQGYQGTQGAGYQGFQGADGPQGNQGAQGSQGAGQQGPRGFAGPQGYQGPQGIPGCCGNHGSKGDTGAQGYQGCRGYQGATGTGSQGAQGSAGSAGSQGAQGSQGSSGAGACSGAGAVYVLQGTGSASASVTLMPGTYRIMLDSRASIVDPGDYDFNVTQSASISGGSINSSVSTSFRLWRAGGSGFGRNIFGNNVNSSGNFTVGSNTYVTLTLNAPNLGGGAAISEGSVLTLIEVATAVGMGASSVGPPGAQGAAGPQGAQGAAGTSGALPGAVIGSVVGGVVSCITPTFGQHLAGGSCFVYNNCAGGTWQWQGYTSCRSWSCASYGYHGIAIRIA